MEVALTYLRNLDRVETFRISGFSFLSQARHARQRIWDSLQDAASVCEERVVMLNILHKPNKPGGHVLLRSVGLQALVVRADCDLGSFDNVPPVIQGIFSC